jgi:hypothetical protein
MLTNTNIVTLVKPKHVVALIVYFNVNFNILKQIYCALVGLIKGWVTLMSCNSSFTPKHTDTHKTFFSNHKIIQQMLENKTQLYIYIYIYI